MGMHFMLSLGVKIEEKFSKNFFDHFLLPKNGFLNFRIRLIIKKSQLCPIAPKFFLVGSWVMKDPTGNRMSSKRPYLLPFRSYGQKTIIFRRKRQKRVKTAVFWP